MDIELGMLRHSRSRYGAGRHLRVFLALLLVESAAGEIHWGSPDANLQVGWECSRITYFVGEPIDLTLHLRRAASQKPAPVLNYMTLLRGLYTIEVRAGGSAVGLTKAGERLADPANGFQEECGISLDSEMANKIRVNEYWDVDKPGDYEMAISHVQIDVKNHASSIAKVPVFRFRVLSRPLGTEARPERR